jgi:hypothetical protein
MKYKLLRIYRSLQEYGLRIIFCSNLYLKRVPESLISVLIKSEFRYGMIALGFSVNEKFLTINLFWWRVIIRWRKWLE